MRLAKIQLARSIWLFDTAEMNPNGASIFPDLISRIAERYHFRQFPKLVSLPVVESLRFDHGEFVQDGRAYEVGLELFKDGITADSRHSTEISDLFILDVITSSCEGMDLKYSPMMGKKRAYRSEVIVYADSGLAGLCEKFDRLSAALRDASGAETEMTAVTFGRHDKLSLFSFERKMNEPLEDLKFYSAAMMQTQAHLNILQVLGTILSDGLQEDQPRFEVPTSIDQ